jgi:hypothetical protein
MRMAFVPITSRLPTDVAEGVHVASRRHGLEIQELLETALRQFLTPADLAEAAGRAPQISEEAARREQDRPRQPPGGPRKHPPFANAAQTTKASTVSPVEFPHSQLGDGTTRPSIEWPGSMVRVPNGQGVE